MKKLLISIIAILICVFVGDRIIGKLMWYVNQHSKDISAPKLKYLSSIIDDDMVFLGTSRCNQHYVPQIFEDSLGLSCYNGGIDASSNIYSQYCILNIMLNHHIPKIICLDVMPTYYGVQNDPFNTLSFFAPYMDNNEESDKMFKLAGTYNIYKVSHTMRYNAKAVSNIVGCVYTPHNNFEKGYLPSSKPPKYPSSIGKTKTPEIDSLKINYLQMFIDKCHEYDIKLIFCVSPMFTTVDFDIYQPLYKIAQENNILWFDYHSTGLYLDHPEYFKDQAHLWNEGAIKFSTLFAHDLKECLQ